jgi:DNA-binding transcriptional regulator YiaG
MGRGVAGSVKRRIRSLTRSAKMTPVEYREVIEGLGLSQIAASRLLGVDARTSRRWALGERDIPPPAVRFLRYLIATKKTGEQAMRMLSD